MPVLNQQCKKYKRRVNILCENIKKLLRNNLASFDAWKYSAQDYFVFVNGLEGTLLLRMPLDYETLSNFSVDIRAQVGIL
jgi:hypothetical protein